MAGIYMSQSFLLFFMRVAVLIVIIISTRVDFFETFGTFQRPVELRHYFKL